MLYTGGPWHICMAKSKGDIILRDRMQFTLSTGTQSTVYGRQDLSDYVNAVEKKGLNIKQIFWQLRYPTSAELGNTGMFVPALENVGSGTSTWNSSGIKIYATTRAYENASDVGIASPDVIAVEEIKFAINGTAALGNTILYETVRYGPLDLHPEGYTVVSDLLIGIAVDDATAFASEVLELDLLIIAEPVTVTARDLTEMLTQSQDI